MKMLDDDSTYFYVGYKNTYLADEAIRTASGCPTSFFSRFRPIRELRVRPLKDAATAYLPPKAAWGSMVIDTIRTSETNLGVAFEPAGYFLKAPTSSKSSAPIVSDRCGGLLMSEI